MKRGVTLFGLSQLGYSLNNSCNEVQEHDFAAIYQWILTHMKVYSTKQITDTYSHTLNRVQIIAGQLIGRSLNRTYT